MRMLVLMMIVVSGEGRSLRNKRVLVVLEIAVVIISYRKKWTPGKWKSEVMKARARK